MVKVKSSIPGSEIVSFANLTGGGASIPSNPSSSPIDTLDKYVSMLDRIVTIAGRADSVVSRIQPLFNRIAQSPPPPPPSPRVVYREAPAPLAPTATAPEGAAVPGAAGASGTPPPAVAPISVNLLLQGLAMLPPDLTVAQMRELIEKRPEEFQRILSVFGGK